MRKAFGDLKELVTSWSKLIGKLLGLEIEEKLSRLKGRTALKFPAGADRGRDEVAGVVNRETRN